MPWPIVDPNDINPQRDFSLAIIIGWIVIFIIKHPHPPWPL